MLGLRSVGAGNILFSLMVLTPFLLFTSTGLVKQVWSWQLLTAAGGGDVHWQKMITFAIWYDNLCSLFVALRGILIISFSLIPYRSCGGWTNGGQIAGEIHNPRRSFNFAILIVMALTLTFSLLPLSVAACAYKDNLNNVSILSISYPVMGFITFLGHSHESMIVYYSFMFVGYFFLFLFYF